jgi:hypothetical protein
MSDSPENEVIFSVLLAITFLPRPTLAVEGDRSVTPLQKFGRIASPDDGSHVTKANPAKAGDAKLRD